MSVADAFPIFMGRLRGVREFGAGRARAVCPCPHREDSELWIAVGDRGRLVVRCFPRRSGEAACKVEDVIAAVGCRWAHLWPADEPKPPTGGAIPVSKSQDGEQFKFDGEFQYFDPDKPDKKGLPTLVFAVVKKKYLSGKKDFPTKRPNPAFEHRKAASRDNPAWVWNLDGVKKILYRLPELREKLAARRDRYVFIPEGEKDVETARRIGLVATCNPGGAGKWCEDYSKELAGAHVVIIPDEDEVMEMPGRPGSFACPGIDHARLVAESVLPHAASVSVLRLPGVGAGGDLTEWREKQPVGDGDCSPLVTELLRSAVKIRTAADIKLITPRMEPVWPIPAGKTPASGGNWKGEEAGLFDGSDAGHPAQPVESAPVSPPVPPPAASAPPAVTHDGRVPPTGGSGTAPPTSAAPAAGPTGSVASDLAQSLADLKRAAPLPPRSVPEWLGEVWVSMSQFSAGVGGSATTVRALALTLAAQLLRGVENVPALNGRK